MKVETLPIEKLVPYEANPRTAQDVEKVANSLREYGWRQPIVVDSDFVVVAGHTRLLAAKSLGFETAPVHVAADLTPEQARAYRILDNRSAESSWDYAKLEGELVALAGLGVDEALTGFSASDLDEISKALELPDGSRQGEPVTTGALIMISADSSFVAEIEETLELWEADERVKSVHVS